jgi:hypothetical protein
VKLALPWRRPRPAEPEQPKPDKDEGPPINIRAPREAVYQSFTGQPGPCPRCGGQLRQSYQTYLIATRRGNKITDSFVTGNDMGWFCRSCSTVVINPEKVSELMQHRLSHWDIGDEFAVLGLVDLEAVPKDKRKAPLGEEGNPIPLIEFTNISGAKPGKRRKPKSKARRR